MSQNRVLGSGLSSNQTGDAAEEGGRRRRLSSDVSCCLRRDAPLSPFSFNFPSPALLSLSLSLSLSLPFRNIIRDDSKLSAAVAILKVV